MPYTPSLDAAPTDLELRANVESLEQLHAERREIIKKLAPLALLYGSGGDRAEAQRRQHRDVIGKMLREELPDGKDLAQNRIEALANSDSRHLQFCEELKDRYIEYRHWEIALQEVQERIEDRKAAMYYLSNEARLV